MAIIHDQAQQQFIYVTDEQVQAGKLAYRYVSEHKIDVYTTRVAEAFQGKGIAGELYQAVIAFAVEQNLKIKPSCSYIEKRMERANPELMA